MSRTHLSPWGGKLKDIYSAWFKVGSEDPADSVNAGGPQHELQLNIRAGVWALRHRADTTGRSVQPCAGVVSATDRLSILSATVAESLRGMEVTGEGGME